MYVPKSLSDMTNSSNLKFSGLTEKFQPYITYNEKRPNLYAESYFTIELHFCLHEILKHMTYSLRTRKRNWIHMHRAKYSGHIYALIHQSILLDLF